MQIHRWNMVFYILEMCDIVTHLKQAHNGLIFHITSPDLFS